MKKSVHREFTRGLTGSSSSHFLISVVFVKCLRVQTNRLHFFILFFIFFISTTEGKSHLPVFFLFFFNFPLSFFYYSFLLLLYFTFGFFQLTLFYNSIFFSRLFILFMYIPYTHSHFNVLQWKI